MEYVQPIAYEQVIVCREARSYPDLLQGFIQTIIPWLNQHKIAATPDATPWLTDLFRFWFRSFVFWPTAKRGELCHMFNKFREQDVNNPIIASYPQRIRDDLNNKQSEIFGSLEKLSVNCLPQKRRYTVIGQEHPILLGRQVPWLPSLPLALPLYHPSMQQHPLLASYLHRSLEKNHIDHLLFEPANELLIADIFQTILDLENRYRGLHHGHKSIIEAVVNAARDLQRKHHNSLDIECIMGLIPLRQSNRSKGPIACVLLDIFRTYKGNEKLNLDDARFNVYLRRSITQGCPPYDQKELFATDTAVENPRLMQAFTETLTYYSAGFILYHPRYFRFIAGCLQDLNRIIPNEEFQDQVDWWYLARCLDEKALNAIVLSSNNYLESSFSLRLHPLFMRTVLQYNGKAVRPNLSNRTK